MSVDGRQIVITNGGSLSSIVLSTGTGNGGTVRVNAPDSINIQGFNSVLTSNSVISSSTLGDGNAGDVIVDTARLTLTDAGLVGSSTTARGDAGNVEINATQEIDIQGKNPKAAIQLTTVGSAGAIANETLQLLFGLPAFPSGNAGNTEVTTPVLSITDGGELSVKNEGIGESGAVLVSANRIYLNSDGNITAQTNVGSGGSIDLNVDEVLLMRRGSLINTEAQSIGNGGNILITAPIIISLDNSDIVADAVRGNGGDVNITAQGIFGLEFRDQRTLESDITASSEFGVEGTVEINNLTVDSALALVELPSAPADADGQIATACASESANQFIASGRGGLPVSPGASLLGNRSWTDIRNVLRADIEESEVSEAGAIAINQTPEIIEEDFISEQLEASGWRLDRTGNVELLFASQVSPSSAIYSSTCLVQQASVK